MNNLADDTGINFNVDAANNQGTDNITYNVGTSITDNEGSNVVDANTGVVARDI
jgi:hypothetical protein